MPRFKIQGGKARRVTRNFYRGGKQQQPILNI